MAFGRHYSGAMHPHPLSRYGSLERHAAHLPGLDWPVTQQQFSSEVHVAM